MAALGNNKNTESGTTVSEENTAMLPDDKKSQSDVITKRTNIILLLVGIAMIAVLVVSTMMTTGQVGSDVTEMKNIGVDSQTEQQQLQEIEYSEPIVSFSPDALKMDNIIVNEDTMQQLLMSVTMNPIKVTDISVSYDVAGLNVDKSDCLERESISPSSGCSINISWTPEKRENKNLFLIVKYDELDDTGAKRDEKTAKITINLQSIEPEKKVEEKKDVFDENAFESELKEEVDEDEEEEDESEDNEPAPAKKSAATMDNQETAPTRVITPDNCKKYASKAYDFSGTFIGWVQGNNSVFAPNCSKIIGTMQEDGMVMEVGTGRIIGKGVILDKKKSEEKRIELELPMLEEVMQTITQKPQEPDYEEIMNNRRIAKDPNAGGAQNEAEDGTWKYRIADTLGIGKAEKKKLVPMGIGGVEQISSLPKDERYVLRQSKPIPAVLNRSIYFYTGSEAEQPVTATVEKNVYGGKGRTIIIPSGSQIIGNAHAPGDIGLVPVQKIGITWKRLIRPDGAEFNFGEVGNYSADAQGRAGVAGKNDTQYMQQLFLKPLLYSALPVAMEALFPTTSDLVTRVQRTDGTYQTIASAINANEGRDGNNVASTSNDYGYVWNNTQTMLNMSSKDKMKAEVQQNFKTVMHKLIEDSTKQKIPFTIPAGTRIQIFLDKDVMLRIADDMNDLFSEEAGEERSMWGESGIPSSGGSDAYGGDYVGGYMPEEDSIDTATTLSSKASFSNKADITPVEKPAPADDDGGDDDGGVVYEEGDDDDE